jgi:hypothetical protein
MTPVDDPLHDGVRHESLVVVPVLTLGAS